MDSEEYREIQQARRLGHPQTDEGPYYHEPFWEAYKGSVKGKLGGAVIGAGLGAAVGVAAAIAVPFVGGVLLTGSALALTVGGFSAAGLLYGAHEFADNGRIAGGLAAGLEIAEKRNDAKLARLEGKIDKLHAAVGGEPVAEDAKTADAQGIIPQEGLEYKTTHMDNHTDVTERPKLIFWKVALIGLAVGAAVGAILASGGLAAHALELVGFAGEGGVLSTTGVMAASVLTMGLFGASFGINRDLFRQVFDKTDLMFRGILGKDKSPEPTLIIPTRLPQQTQQPDYTNTAAADAPVATVVMEAPAQEEKPRTYHQDKVMASARQALLSLDHTKSIRH